MKKQYVKAVAELLLQGKDVEVVLGNLQKSLATKGMSQLYAGILHGVLVQLQAQQKSGAAQVTVAKAQDAQAFEDAITQALHALGTDLDEATVVEDKTLIGGYVASFNGKRLNNSYKEKLVSLYRSITTH